MNQSSKRADDETFPVRLLGDPLVRHWRIGLRRREALDRQHFHGLVRAGKLESAGRSRHGDTAFVFSNVVNLSSDVVIEQLVFRRGRIEGTGNLTATNCSWSGGAIAGSGILVVPSDGLLTLPAVELGTTRDLERILENSGTIELIAGNLDLRASNCEVHNFGVFEMYGGTGLAGPPFASLFENAGSFIKTGVKTNLVSVALHNTGQMRILSGTLHLAAPLTNSGDIYIAETATLQVAARWANTFGHACKLGGRGILRTVNARLDVLCTNSIEPRMEITAFGPYPEGTVFFNAPVSVGTCILSNSAIGGTNTVTITNFQWQAGWVAGGGTIVIPPLGIALISSNGAFDDWTLQNNGTVEFKGPFDSVGRGNRRIVNTGVFDLQGDAPFFGTFQNQGQIVKSAGTGTCWLGFVTNTGTIVSRSGTLGFVAYNQLSGETLLHGGNFKVPEDGMFISGGRVEGAGAIYGHPNDYWYGILRNNADLNPGAPIGRLETGSLWMAENGRLNIQIGGLIQGVDYDCIIAKGASYLYGGSLNITVTNGFVPNLGDRFEILTYWRFGAPRPEFSKITGTHLTNGLMFLPQYSSTNIVLVVTNAPLQPGYLSGTRHPWGGYRLFFKGQEGTRYVIQASTMFDDWIDLVTNSAASGLVYFDYDARDHYRRFYRLRIDQ